jgi:two-component system NtrC family sensor kinase
VDPAHPLPGPVPLSELTLVGLLLQWAVGVLLLVLFIQLPRFSAHRALLWTWVAAWAALIVGHTGEAISAWAMLNGTLLAAPVSLAFGLIELPARLAFLALITMAAAGAAGRAIHGLRQRQVATAVAVVGLLLAFLDTSTLGRSVQLVATPLLFFGSAQLVLAAARGERERGLTFLAVGMVLFAATATLLQLAEFGQLPFVDAVTLARLRIGSGYAQAFATALLGAAVVVLVVQDSVLQAARAREDHLRDVGASEARLKRIIEAAGEAIVTFGPDRCVDMANAAAARLFRFPAGSVVGRRLEDLVDLGESTWERALAPALTTPAGQVTLTATGRRPSDGSFPIEFTVGPLDQEEHPGGGVAIMRDLTQRIAADLERERFERRYAESEKMLAIGRVVSGVAHELNNPLAVVLGQSEEMVTSNVSAEVRGGLQLINEQAHRARHIVKDLLAFVRHREDRRETVALGDLVARTVVAQASEARRHEVTVQVDATRPGPTVTIDALGLEQVLVNLIDNAMDSAGAGGEVRIVVETQQGHGLVAVEDNGLGVPDELVGRIFEPFFTTKPTGQGTGLGLAVSVGLLEQHGGTLTLENRPRPGVGARFVVRLPLAREVVPDRRQGSQAGSGTFTGPQVVPGHALVVDDEPAVRSTIVRIFRRWGWQVREVGSGAEALDVLADPSSDQPGLILCDLKMPGMTGAEFYRTLQARHPALTSRLIFVTGDVVEPDTAQFLGSAGREVVEKPFTMSEIARAVERVVRMH